MCFMFKRQAKDKDQLCSCWINLGAYESGVELEYDVELEYELELECDGAADSF